MNACMCMCARNAGGWILCTIHTMINFPKDNSSCQISLSYFCMHAYMCYVPLAVLKLVYMDEDIQDRELDLSERSM